MPPLTSIINLPTKMAANYDVWADTVYKINEIHNFSNSRLGWSIDSLGMRLIVLNVMV